jgi:hypothetical protein
LHLERLSAAVSISIWDTERAREVAAGCCYTTESGVRRQEAGVSEAEEAAGKWARLTAVKLVSGAGLKTEIEASAQTLFGAGTSRRIASVPQNLPQAVFRQEIDGYAPAGCLGPQIAQKSRVNRNFDNGFHRRFEITAASAIRKCAPLLCDIVSKNAGVAPLKL